MPRITLVIPCFNEAKRLDTAAFQAFREDGVLILFVNDGSTDGTAAILQTLVDGDPGRYRLLDLPRNVGKAEAVRMGMQAAFSSTAELAGFWDADLATPLDELASFVRVLDDRPGTDVVFGARVRLLGRHISRRPARHYLGRMGATLISASLGLAIYDTQCGAKLFRIDEHIRRAFATPFLSRWIFDVEIIARLVQERGRDAVANALCELPVRRWHDVPGSKVRSTDFFRALGDLWKIHRAYNSHP